MPWAPKPMHTQTQGQVLVSGDNDDIGDWSLRVLPAPGAGSAAAVAGSPHCCCRYCRCCSQPTPTGGPLLRPELTSTPSLTSHRLAAASLAGLLAFATLTPTTTSARSLSTDSYHNLQVSTLTSTSPIRRCRVNVHIRAILEASPILKE